jgi:hypothetical protein
MKSLLRNSPSCLLMQSLVDTNILFEISLSSSRHILRNISIRNFVMEGAAVTVQDNYIYYLPSSFLLRLLFP